MEFRIIGKDEVEKKLQPGLCVELMERTLRMQAQGQCVQYLRTAIPLPNTNVLGLMPAWFGDYFGVKVLSVYHTNGGSAYPSHQGQILLFGAQHGELLAGIDADSITRIRTGAVSAAVSRALARSDSDHLALLGCGAQSISHLKAMQETFCLKTVSVWDRNPAACEKLREFLKPGVEFRICTEVRSAVEDADIICTLTFSAEPILEAEWVKPGAHINAVGACAPDQRELGSSLVAMSSFFCDNVSSVLHESGDYLFPMREGLISESHIRGTAGEVLAYMIPGRTKRDEITVFEALGMAVEDVAAAKYVLDH